MPSPIVVCRRRTPYAVRLRRRLHLPHREAYTPLGETCPSPSPRAPPPLRGCVSTLTPPKGRWGVRRRRGCLHRRSLCRRESSFWGGSPDKCVSSPAELKHLIGRMRDSAYGGVHLKGASAGRSPYYLRPACWRTFGWPTRDCCRTFWLGAVRMQVRQDA